MKGLDLGASGVLSGPIKVWPYPTIGLCVVGATGLAAGWSDAITTGVGKGLGIAVSDADNLGTAFEEGQRAGGGNPDAEPAAADDPAAG